MSSEIYSYLFEKILLEGALDVYIENISMKKNRPAHKITILCKEEDLDKFIDLLIIETSTFGVRYNSYLRKKLNRKFIDIETEFGMMKVKLGYYEGKLIKAKPEYEQCKEIALKQNIPIKKVYEIVNTNINQKVI